MVEQEVIVVDDDEETTEADEIASEMNGEVTEPPVEVLRDGGEEGVDHRKLYIEFSWNFLELFGVN